MKVKLRSASFHQSPPTKYHKVVFCRVSRAYFYEMVYYVVLISCYILILVVFFITDFVQGCTFLFYCCMLGENDGSLSPVGSVCSPPQSSHLFSWLKLNTVNVGSPPLVLSFHSSVYQLAPWIYLKVVSVWAAIIGDKLVTRNCRKMQFFNERFKQWAVPVSSFIHVELILYNSSVSISTKCLKKERRLEF